MADNPAQRSCPTCRSTRCGNHAACARKHAASRQWWANWIEVWEQIGYCASMVIRVQREVPEATIEHVLGAWLQREQERQFKESIAHLFFGFRGRR